MSIHKLTAGSGYDYLTRQVAANDRTEGGYTGLASYYTDKGETPGVWVGSGMTHIDGLNAGDAVTAEQMQSLFGSGHHPLATERAAHLLGDKGALDSELKNFTQLGAPYKVYERDVSAFRLEVAKRIEALNASYGHPRDYPVSIEERAKVRTQVAVAFFHAEHGRAPDGPREIAATIAKHSRQKTTAVAGYDLTFSPVKSISTLWAVAPTDVAAQVELAHQDAVKDALRFVEDHVLYSREGRGGVRQVDVQGLVATAFTHRDSRAGDPDLHTHIAVANKVKTMSGTWLAIDGRLMFKAVVAASETYNTAIEKHLTDRLGVRFAERPNPDARKCPVREIVGVNPALNEAWSSRRVSITARTGVLAAQFQGAHGRPPTPVEAIQLAQQATLETRDAKHEPRTLAEQRATWATQAKEVLGSERAVEAMLTDTLNPTVEQDAAIRADGAWIATTAGSVCRQVEARRSTWQVWHVRAEAHRQVRRTDVPTGQVEGLVELLTERVLTLHSLPVTAPQDTILEPPELRRVDGTSMYEVAGANLFTSADVIAAEERLLAAAGATTGRAVTPAAVSMALLEQTANGATLNPGQVALVRGMATSGATLQLAIAPAGSGKTTAMRALTQAWTSDGGTVIGLAPSAAAAAQLREQTGATTDTLAKLVWSVQTGDLPGWVENINDKTLVVIDEAGMADTLSLDAAVTYATSRGATVRLIGDDQQLAAIGAGGVLRDIATTHGALQLTQLMRFLDPAEGAASLALREGDTAALGFYLDMGRVHVGDLATLSEDVFTSWAHDRSQGLDSIMLAPTRDLVSQLNQRAQTDRLAGATPTSTTGAALSDGNRAYAGELVISRRNERKLPLGGGDWVKNGDRWTVLKTSRGGALVVKHTRTGRTTTLPTQYVTASVELGYATTIHGAQGVSVDTMHGLTAPDQSRQQLYTMLTRGKVANHAYLQVVGDGDPHTVIRPENIHPDTATDLLENILARDDSPRSIATLLREQADPATRLGHATARYTDALYVAAETTLGVDTIRNLDEGADGVVPGITAQPAWPTLRAHLILTAAHRGNPLTHLSAAAAVRELSTAGDTAAVLGWRLDDTGLRGAGPGPLPWVPAIPTTLRTDPTWGCYLTARSDLVSSLAAEVASRASTPDTPAWARQGAGRPADTVLAEVAVWRAANTIPDTDTRPTGGTQLAKAAVLYQRALAVRVAGDHCPALAEWGDLIATTAPTTRGDDFTPVLAQRLAAISRAGLDARALLLGVTTATAGSLPDDHAASAIWWRISRHLAPAVAHDVDTKHHLTPAWTEQLTTALGTDRAAAVQDSPWWPTLVVAVEHALARGEQLTTITDMATGLTGAADVDDAQALVWRLSVLADPPPLAEDPTPAAFEEAPEDAVDLEWFPPDDHEAIHVLQPQEWDTLSPSAAHEDLPSAATTGQDRGDVDADLAAAALGRSAMGVLEPSDADIEAMLDRAAAWDHTTTQPARMIEVNAMAMAYYAGNVDTGWAGPYLDQRLTPAWRDNPHTPAGYAPPGWTHLLDHLRNRGVSDTELLETGLATTARTGRLIDRFRDRALMPITHDGAILGFVGRRHPGATDDGTCGPKYLNTADTALFHKGAQLHGTAITLLEAGAVPVLVEGPLDAYAVTLAGQGRYVGVAPLGTSMTGEQARQLATMHPSPIVATDADPAGRIAAERAYWLLTQHATDPNAIHLPDGTDPASLAANQGPGALLDALNAAHPLREDLVAERLANLPAAKATAAAVRVIGASPSTTWDAALEQLDAPAEQTRQQLRDAVTAFNRDPARAAGTHLEKTREVRARLQANHADPTRRWAALANDLDRRLTTEADWPALANMLQQAHADGHDVHAITRATLAQKPLPQMPAQALRYRLVTALPTQPPINEAQRPTADPAARERASQWNFTPAGPRSTPTR